MDVDIIRDMKNSDKGSVVNFDTSNLKEVLYYAGMEDSESYDNDKGEGAKEDDKDSYQSTEKHKDKLRRFRRARIKAWITAVEKTDDSDLNCVRFIEVDHHEEFNNMREGSQGELADLHHKEVIIEEDKKEEQASNLEENKDNQQDEEIRQIKDSRSMMSEKKNPKSIKILQRMFIILALMAIGSEIFLKVRRVQGVNDLNDRVSKYLSLFRRNIILTDIGYYLRKYELLINNKFSTTIVANVTATKAAEKARILELVKKLENEQKTCATAHTDIDSSKYAFNYNYTFEQPMSTGTVSTVVNSYSDSVYTLSSAVTITVNSEETQLDRTQNTPTKLTSGEVSFRRYMQNVFRNMRIGGEEYTSRYKSLTESKIKSNWLFALIYCLCQIASVAITVTILIRYVFDVMNKNKEVMTLFAMIERDQIKKLKSECVQFIDKNLKDLFDSESSEDEADGKPEEQKIESSCCFIDRCRRV